LEKIYLRPVEYLYLIDELEDEALMIVSNAFCSAIQESFGPIRPKGS